MSTAMSNSVTQQTVDCFMESQTTSDNEITVTEPCASQPVDDSIVDKGQTTKTSRSEKTDGEIVTEMVTDQDDEVEQIATTLEATIISLPEPSNGEVLITGACATGTATTDSDTQFASKVATKATIADATMPKTNEIVANKKQKKNSYDKYKKKFQKNKKAGRVVSGASNSSTALAVTISNQSDQTSEVPVATTTAKAIANDKHTEKKTPKKKYNKKKYGPKTQIPYSNLNGQVVNGVLYVTNELPFQQSPILIARAPPVLTNEVMGLNATFAANSHNTPFNLRTKHSHKNNAIVPANNSNSYTKRGPGLRHGNKNWNQAKSSTGDENFYGSNPFPNIINVDGSAPLEKVAKTDKLLSFQSAETTVNSVNMIGENNMTSTSLNTIVDSPTN